VLRRIGVTEDDRYALDARELFRRMVFNILIDNTDDHEKNHSLLVVHPAEHGRLKLAPAYDVLPTNSGQGYQEFICGADGGDSTLDNAMSQCDAFGLTQTEAVAQVGEVIAIVNAWKAHFETLGVSSGDITQLTEWIDGDTLLAQRRGFDSGHYQQAPARRKRESPFRRR
jgi:serine/threonine-protein kinase HipA